MNKIWLIIICLFLFVLTGCKDNKDSNPDKEPDIPPHECIEGEWEFPEGTNYFF